MCILNLFVISNIALAKEVNKSNVTDSASNVSLNNYSKKLSLTEDELEDLINETITKTEKDVNTNQYTSRNNEKFINEKIENIKTEKSNSSSFLFSVIMCVFFGAILGTLITGNRRY